MISSCVCRGRELRGGGSVGGNIQADCRCIRQNLGLGIPYSKFRDCEFCSPSCTVHPFRLLRTGLLQEFVELTSNAFPANGRGRLYCATPSATLGLLILRAYVNILTVVTSCKNKHTLAVDLLV